jgi:tetratricopeptide (TPR) repeat protein
MPHLAALVGRGVIGTPHAPQPLLPELIWASLATGRRAADHGILSSRGAAGRRVSLRERRCPAFWDAAAQAGMRSHLINWPLTEPAEATSGACLSDTFFALVEGNRDLPPEHLVAPVHLAPELAPWRVRPDEVDDATLRFFVPQVDRVARQHDDRPSRVASAVARALSVQAMTLWFMEHQPAEIMAVRFELLSDLSSWALPLAPPKLGSASQWEFDLYQHVLTRACHSLDLLLGSLVARAGENASVVLVSDCGLLSAHARPDSLSARGQAGNWRSARGMLVMAGPQLRRDEVITSTQLLDVAPTVLALAGVGEFPAEGRVLTEAFAGELGPPSGPAAPAAIAPPVPANDEAAWNLALSLVDARRFDAALDVLDSLHADRPEAVTINRFRFECQLSLGRLADAHETLERLRDFWCDSPAATLSEARLLYAARRFERSLDCLAKIESSTMPLPKLHLQVGLNLIKLNQSSRAAAAFQREIDSQLDSAEAHGGLAYCHLRAARFQSAIEHASAALALEPNLYQASFVLGLAQARLGHLAQARAVFERITKSAPDFAPAYRCLAILHAGDSAAVGRYRDSARRARSSSWGF